MNQIKVTYSDKALGIARQKQELLTNFLFHCDVDISIDIDVHHNLDFEIMLIKISVGTRYQGFVVPLDTNAYLD